MDPIWFGFATSGTLIVPWPGNTTGTKAQSPDVAKTLLSGIATETVHTSPIGTSGRPRQRTSQLSQGDGIRFVAVKTFNELEVLLAVIFCCQQ